MTSSRNEPALQSDVWIVTDAAGCLTDCSPLAAQLLGYSARGARGRTLPNVFITERPRLSELLEVAGGGVIQRKARLRPNDRRSIDVLFRIERLESEQRSPMLLWTFAVQWPIALRIPRGTDRRQVITVWRSGAVRCVFVPGGANRRLLVCVDDEVVLEEAPSDPASALTRAAELERLARVGELATQLRTSTD